MKQFFDEHRSVRKPPLFFVVRNGIRLRVYDMILMDVNGTTLRLAMSPGAERGLQCIVLRDVDSAGRHVHVLGKGLLIFSKSQTSQIRCGQEQKG